MSGDAFNFGMNLPHRKGFEVDDLSGFVKWYSIEKGFGFIDAGGQDYFFHFTDVSKTTDSKLRKGNRVSFKGGSAPRGLKATHVVIL